MDNWPPDFIAILKFRTTEEGGRSTPAFSCYRPHIKFPFAEMRTSGEQRFIGKSIVHPGETIEAEIRILAVSYFANSLFDGLEFEFNEGSRNVGTGKIIQVLNEKLKKTVGNNPTP